MTDLTFPTDPTFLGTLQQPLQLWNIMGSFWRNILTDTELLQYQEFAKLQNHGDVYLYGLSVAAAGSIQQVTPFVPRQWRMITLLESELTQAPNLIQYGSGQTYGNGTIYGQVAANSYIWPLPEDIQQIGLIVDTIINPVNVFDLSNSNYNPETNLLQFAVNPFTLLNPAPVYDANGDQTDSSINLFIRNVGEDQNTTYLRYGAVIGVEGTSSQSYLEVVQSVWSMLVRGPSVQALWQGLLASAGLPYCAGNETVQIVQTDDHGLAIITDQNVYRFDITASALVSVGDVLIQGQPLVDTVEIFELGSGTPPDFSSLKGLSLGPGLMNTVGELVFPNLDGSYTWTGTDAQFTIYGNASDIAAFWATVASRGITQGDTLASLAGVSATSGPVAVNPMEFLIENVFGNNVILATVKPQAFLADQAGFAARVKGLIPAGTLLLVQIELDLITDQYNLAASPNVATVYNGLGVIPTEVIAPTGSNLTFTHGTPRIWNA